MLKPADKIVVLTGAGVSKESGLDTFRCADGIWAKVRLEDVATPEGFARNPKLVHEFYNKRRRDLQAETIQPNPAHAALARLEREWPGEVLLVTQNIDNLHERAGSTTLIHMHGELLKKRCSSCGAVSDIREDLSTGDPCGSCGRVGGLRPHVVWFGEMPLEMDRIFDALATCRLFMSIGTSGNVYPAAGFVQQARMFGAQTIELNLEPSQGATQFQDALYGAASAVVPAYVERLLNDP